MDTQDDNMFPSLSDAVLNDDYEKKQCTFKSARFLTRRYNPLTDRNRGKMKTMSLACKINLPVPGSSRTLQGDTSNYWVENKSPTLSTSLNQSSDYNSIPCNQAQHVSVDEIPLESIADADKVTTNSIFGSPTKLPIDNSEQLNTSANVISSQILDENLSASTLASFEKSFHTSQKDMTIVDNRELNNTMFQSFDVTDMSQLHKSSNFRNEIINTFNVCEMSVCQLNDTIGMIKDKNDVKSKHSTFLDESNDSFMLNVPLNISKIHEFVKPNPKHLVSNQQDANYFYGLPSLAKTLVSQYKGIDKLYDWQNECLTLPAIEKRQNLIYALPTSGGKTLVAEILMLREVICRKKNVLFVVPFVSIVQEKVWGLSPFAVSLDFFVEEYAGGKGSYPPRKRRTKKSIYIATIEKGLGLVRSLTETKRLSEIGLIVVDELHLLGEPNRGCTLEMLLTNVMYSGESIQIIGMSATIGNIEELASFLNAQIFTKDFRPVELKEYFKCGKDIMNINWKASTESEKITHSRKIDFGYSAEVEKIDPDHLGGLVMEVIPNSSCLIFCPTKKNAENVAVILCRVIAKTILEHRKQEKCALLEALREENNGENLLLSLIPWGVAYHHSGLAFEERRLIEECFRSGVLNVLCCTSTLAAGVNLPAQRVILRAPMVGRNFINLSMYKQMVGRAGRTGLAGQGDSILICAPFQTEKVKALLASPMDHVCSSLHADNSLNMRNFLLSAVASEIATNLNALKKLMKKSLLSVQAERLNVSVKDIVKETVSTLFRMHAIVLKSDESKDTASLNMSVTIDQTMKQAIDEPTDDEAIRKPGKRKINISDYTELTVSKLGKAAVRGGMQLSRAHQLNKDLKEAQNGLVLIGIGHLLYLVTPYDLAESIKPNLALYYSVLTTMNPGIAQTSRLLGFTQATEVQMAMGKQPKNIPERVLNRFYVTLMLYDLWNQVSLQTVSEKYQVNRGTVQSMMEQASTFASGVLRFCEEMDEFWAFKDLLKTFSLRLSHCCISELEPLMELPSVKKSRALQLYKAGFKTIKDIAKATPSDLMETIEHVTLRTANQLIAAAKLSLLEKVENLREDVQDVMDDMGILEK